MMHPKRFELSLDIIKVQNRIQYNICTDTQLYVNKIYDFATVINKK